MRNLARLFLAIGFVTAWHFAALAQETDTPSPYETQQQGFDAYNRAIQENSDRAIANADEFGNVLRGNSTYQNPDTGDQVVLPYYYNSDPQVDTSGNVYTQDQGGNWQQNDTSGGSGTELVPAQPAAPVEVPAAE